jgi:tripartite-type tricarboxylate transporter receptor subunit TctC
MVHPNVPARTMKQFIALAKASPGKYTYASAGYGSLGHVHIEHFSQLAGIELRHVRRTRVPGRR